MKRFEAVLNAASSPNQEEVFDPGVLQTRSLLDKPVNMNGKQVGKVVEVRLMETTGQIKAIIEITDEAAAELLKEQPWMCLFEVTGEQPKGDSDV